MPRCTCPDGTYEDGVSFNCPKCDNKCVACRSKSNCIDCRGNRRNPPDCKYNFELNILGTCPLGTFENN